MINDNTSRALIIGTLATDSFVSVNKRFLKYFKGDATLALVLCELISIYKYQLANGMVNELDAFPLPVAFLESTLALSHFKQQNALKRLQTDNLLTAVVMGKPASRWVTLNFDAIQSVFAKVDNDYAAAQKKKKDFYETINEAVAAKDDYLIEEALDNIKEPLRGCIIIVNRYLNYECVWDGEAIGKLKHVVNNLDKYSAENLFDYGRFLDLLKLCEAKELKKLIVEMQYKWKRIPERAACYRIFSYNLSSRNKE